MRPPICPAADAHHRSSRHDPLHSTLTEVHTWPPARIHRRSWCARRKTSTLPPSIQVGKRADTGRRPEGQAFGIHRRPLGLVSTPWGEKTGEECHSSFLSLLPVERAKWITCLRSSQAAR